MENYENYEVESNEVTETDNNQVLNYDEYRYESRSNVGKAAAYVGIGAGIGFFGYMIYDKFVRPAIDKGKEAYQHKKAVEQAKKEIVEERIRKKQQEQEVEDADFREVKKEEEPKKKK